MQLATRAHVTGKYPHCRVAVYEIAFGIDEQCSISIAIESNAHVSVFSQDAFLQSLDMERTAIEIDVSTVRLIVDGDYSGPEVAKEFRRDFRSRAVRTIDNDLHLVQRQALADLMFQVVEVAIAQVNCIFLVGRMRRVTRF